MESSNLFQRFEGKIYFRVLFILPSACENSGMGSLRDDPTTGIGIQPQTETESEGPEDKDSLSRKYERETRRWWHWIQNWVRQHRATVSAVTATTAGMVTLMWWIVVHRKNRAKRQCLMDKSSPRPTATHSIPTVPSSSVVVPLSLLMAALEQGRLQKALLGTTRILFQTKTEDQISNKNNSSSNPEGTISPKSQSSVWQQTMLPRGNETLKQHILSTLHKAAAATTRSHQSSSLEIDILPETDYSAIATTILAALPFVYLALVYRLMRNQTGVDSHTAPFNATSNDTGTTTTFADVAGLDEAVASVSDILHYLHNPQRYRAYGVQSPPRAILLYGPPGTGKTLLARAVAGQARKQQQQQVVFVPCSASDFVEVYVGRGAARVRALFDSARRQAQQLSAMISSQSRNWMLDRLGQWMHQFGFSSLVPLSSPAAHPMSAAIIFIDELDCLARTRSSTGLLAANNDEREQTLNQLLTEMDGFHTNSPRDNVTLVVIAATNRADVLDPAILRRFDRCIHVGYPDSAARLAILRVHTDRAMQTARSRTSAMSRPDDTAESFVPDVDFARLATDEITGHMTGSDLRNLVNDAALLAVRENAVTLTQEHFEEAARRIRVMKSGFRKSY
jgi:cell division protease FtsH